MPTTSVIASRGPGFPSKGIPRVRARGLSAANSGNEMDNARKAANPIFLDTLLLIPILGLTLIVASINSIKDFFVQLEIPGLAAAQVILILTIRAKRRQ